MKSIKVKQKIVRSSLWEKNWFTYFMYIPDNGYTKVWKPDGKRKVTKYKIWTSDISIKLVVKCYISYKAFFGLYRELVELDLRSKILNFVIGSL